MDFFFVSLIASMILNNVFSLPSLAAKDRKKRDDYDNEFHGIGSIPLDNNVPDEFLNYLALPHEDEHEYSAYNPPVLTYDVPSTTYEVPAPPPTYGAPAPSPTYGTPVPSPTYVAPAPAPILVPVPVTPGAGIGVTVDKHAVLAPKVELFRFIEAFIQFKKELIVRLQHLLNDNWDLIRGIINLVIGKLQKLQGFTLVFISILRQIFEFAVGLFSQFSFNLPSVSVGVASQVHPIPSLGVNVPDILSTLGGLFRG